MDHRQRSLIATAIKSNIGRVEGRLREGDPFAIVEITEFLQEIDDDDLQMDVIRGLVSSLPAVQAGAIIGAHPEWTTLVGPGESSRGR